VVELTRYGWYRDFAQKMVEDVHERICGEMERVPC